MIESQLLLMSSISFENLKYRLEITHSVAPNLKKPRANRTEAELKLRQLSESDARIIILYAMQRQAEVIFEIARDF